MSEKTYCYVQVKNQTRTYLRGRLGKPATCCGWISAFLCDYPVGDNKTCDKRLCEEHAYEIAPEIHYCSAHYDEWKKFVNSGGVKAWLKNIRPFKQSPFFNRRRRL